MARIASDEITLTRLAEPTAVRLYYAKVTSVPPTPPALPNPNPSTTLPKAPWFTTEPAYTGGETATVYTTMVTSYGANYHVCGERQLYSAYEAAKAAWNKANGAVTQVRVEFAVSSSNTTAPTTGWSTGKPNKVVGQFIWTQTITTTGAGSAITYGPALLTGDKGEQGPQGNQGLQGVQGIQGTQGIGFKELAVYYMLLDKTELPPVTPTTMTPSAGWSLTEPAWAKDKNLWRTMRTTFVGNNTFLWTPVSKVSTYQAADAAMQEAIDARHYANIALDDVTVSAVDPAIDAVGHYQGRIWMPVNEADEITGVLISTGNEWKTMAILGGLMVVPGADGAPAFFADQKGVEVSNLVAGAIMATEIVGGRFEGLELDISTVSGRLAGFPEHSESFLQRVNISPSTIRISNTYESGNKTEMVLEAEKLVMNVKNTRVIGLDSGRREIETPNVYVREDMTVSGFKMSTVGANNDILTFSWVGVRA